MSLSLNCLILGDDPEEMFTVEIQKTKNLSILKDMIKGKEALRLAHIDASDLELWKFCLPFDDLDTILSLKQVGSNSNTKLSPPIMKLSAFFDEAVDDVLHIIVEAPEATRPVSLNCLILGEGLERMFTVEIQKTKNLSILKDLIKEKKARRLAHINASDLELWKVCLPFDDLDAISSPKQFESTSNTKLSPPATKLSAFFDEVVDEVIHIIAKVPPALDTISSSSSNKSNTRVLMGLSNLHTHLWGENRIVYRDETACLTLDLELFNVLNLNTTRPDNILLVREEYQLAYDYILKDTLKNLTTKMQRSVTLVTGQPGIGKTLFLFYVLTRRLRDKQPVAFQINRRIFALFDQDGVTLQSTEEGCVPQGIWALSDSDSLGGQNQICTAFRNPAAHVVHTSSPSSSRWKNWVKRLSAGTYIMDVWSLKELQILFALKTLDFREGKYLFEKYGPNPRIIIDILTKKTEEGEYERKVKAAAYMLACNFSAVCLRLDDLDFSADVSSKIFIVKPPAHSRKSYVLEIPTNFLSCTFGLAMARQVAGQQHFFFRMLSMHPSFCQAGGLLFEEYAHNWLSEPKREPLKAHNLDGTVHHIPVPTKILAGSTVLKQVQPPHNFYWRPVKPNFKGVDAIIRSGDDVWVLRYTISRKHKAVTDGLNEICDGMNHKRNVKWHLVMISSDLTNAMAAREDQKLAVRDNVQVYASELPMGQFNEPHAKYLQTILNYPNDKGLVPDQRADSGDPMDESL